MEEDEVRIPARATGAAGNLGKAMRKNNGDSTPAHEALDLFLQYCVAEHRAEHYLLFLVGHGMIVGNDAFLPDEFPKSAITLKKLGVLLNRFSRRTNGGFELLAMHSCSMSGVEVVYEVQGTAKYMIASEGLSFVAGWPYRQLLKKLFNALENDEELENLIESLYWESFFNAKDFVLSGYPLELALVSLESSKLKGLTAAMKELVRELRASLKNDVKRDLIQLSHLKAQSYFDENYTDLYDFCFCLSEHCKKGAALKSLKESCAAVMRTLEPITPTERHEARKRFEALIVHSSYLGWTFQYSHGLCIYFPWSEPVRKSSRRIINEYREYAFATQLKLDSWAFFLMDYWKETMRSSRGEEDPRWGNGTRLNGGSTSGSPSGSLPDDGTPPDSKPTGGFSKPTGGSGQDCNCASIKNYPRNPRGAVPRPARLSRKT
jgi:hypothetical protein